VLGGLTPPRPLHPVSLPTGTQWGIATERGLGSLRVENGTPQDAVAALFDAADAASRAVYVRAHESATIQGIASRTYALRFSLGLDWDETTRAFRYDPSFSQFLKPLEYRETPTENGTVYEESHVTLHAVPGGNARTDRIKALKFNLSGLVRVPRQ
jgi:hypothetical protein